MPDELILFCIVVPLIAYLPYLGYQLGYGDAADKAFRDGYEAGVRDVPVGVELYPRGPQAVLDLRFDSAERRPASRTDKP